MSIETVQRDSSSYRHNICNSIKYTRFFRAFCAVIKASEKMSFPLRSNQTPLCRLKLKRGRVYAVCTQSLLNKM